MSHASTLDRLAAALTLGDLLRIARTVGSFEIVDHWQQGEFHHDIVLGFPRSPDGLPGRVLVVATNCNGGVKELLVLDEVPTRGALWHARCPDNPEFDGELPAVLEAIRTPHWFDPCELLERDARSEYRPEFRERQRGGGWVLRK